MCACEQKTGNEQRPVQIRRQTQAGETNESKVGEFQPKKFERKQP